VEVGVSFNPSTGGINTRNQAFADYLMRGGMILKFVLFQ
jgi:hypothetical protein